MFDPATETAPNWDTEIRDDVIDECSRHGAVLHIYVDKMAPQGNVYVKCNTVASAVESVNSLHGRWFAGKFLPSFFLSKNKLPSQNLLLVVSTKSSTFFRDTYECAS
jgi:RNA-binding protein 39